MTELAIQRPDARRMGFFTDTTVCIGCKACEVACKQWNDLPADGSELRKGGSYDHTGSLGAATWRHVRFVEQPDSWGFMSDVCKHCTHAGCLDACPTGALVAPGVLDNPRCISFLTIELKDRIPRALRPLMGDWIFGCDLCQEVCPVNRKGLPACIAALRAYDDEAAYPRLLPLLASSDAEFRARYRGTPVLRAKQWGLQRNVCVALGNSRDPAAVSALSAVLLNQAAHPLVREHAAWALSRFDEPAARRILERAWTTEAGGANRGATQGTAEGEVSAHAGGTSGAGDAGDAAVSGDVGLRAELALALDRAA